MLACLTVERRGSSSRMLVLGECPCRGLSLLRAHIDGDPALLTDGVYSQRVDYCSHKRSANLFGIWWLVILLHPCR
jgi:hypothetical protein